MKLSLFSLNLHGYHPLGEARRWLEDREGRCRPAGLYPMGEALFYYTTEELDRGHRRRLDRLGQDLARLAPDILCLQEVGAGCPWTPRNAEIFHRVFPEDWFEANSALRLLTRLNAQAGQERPWQAALACRGNVGWHTGPGLFARERVVTFSGTQRRIVHEFDSVPYPDGLLVEGFAILVRQPWEIIDQQEWNLVVNSLSHKVFVQVAALRRTDSQEGRAPWFVLANVHLGHKVTHFEQAVALRAALLDYRGKFPDPESCVGTIIAGDFNAVQYRPRDGVRDAGMIPWEVRVDGQFDFRPEAEAYGELLAALWAMNDDRQYKPWASIRDAGEARGRIEEAAERFLHAQEKAPADWPGLVDGLDVARRQDRICALSDLPSAASIPNRIDFLMTEPHLSVESACVVYPENSFITNTGTSDHPACLVNYQL